MEESHANVRDLLKCTPPYPFIKISSQKEMQVMMEGQDTSASSNSENAFENSRELEEECDKLLRVVDKMVSRLFVPLLNRTKDCGRICQILIEDCSTFSFSLWKHQQL